MKCQRSAIVLKRLFRLMAGLLAFIAMMAGLGFPAVASEPQPESHIAFAARVDGNWDLYSVRPDGTDLRRLTADPAEDRAPAFSPDGKALLFQSRRSGNWDIYRLDLATGAVTQLTHDPDYDGMPAWSPDGRRIAFESTRAGDLDIFVMSAAGASPTNLTAESPAGEMEPAWSPDGQHIAFVSWRQQDKDIYRMVPDGTDVVQMTNSPMGEDQPAWSPDGMRMLFVHRTPEHREIMVLNALTPPAQGGLTTRLTWSTANEWPTWSPDGRQLAWLEHTFNGWKLQVGCVSTESCPTSAILPTTLIEGRALAGPISWSASALPYGEPVPANFLQTHPQRRYIVRWIGLDSEQEAPIPRIGWTRVPNVIVPNERLNASVAPAFEALRRAILEASGYDFLAELSDAWRPLEALSETSLYVSWHKAGRAIDLLFEYRDGRGYPLLEVVREDIGGETYWRLYLRCARQDGSQGGPLREHPWDFDAQVRTRDPERGGRWKAIPAGYYVDLTDLADVYGWERISSVDEPEYSWKWHFLAIEYWHYQRDEGLDWYTAMRQVYTEEDLLPLLNWEEVGSNGIPDWQRVYAGVPVPLRESRWRWLQP